MAFIIGTYNKFEQWDRRHAKYLFQINERWYAIYEVDIEWGLPVLPTRVEYDEHPEQYCIYEKFEDAMKFVMMMKGMNAR